MSAMPCMQRVAPATRRPGAPLAVLERRSPARPNSSRRVCSAKRQPGFLPARSWRPLLRPPASRWTFQVVGWSDLSPSLSSLPRTNNNALFSLVIFKTPHAYATRVNVSPEDTRVDADVWVKKKTRGPTWKPHGFSPRPYAVASVFERRGYFFEKEKKTNVRREKDGERKLSRNRVKTEHTYADACRLQSKRPSPNQRLSPSPRTRRAHRPTTRASVQIEKSREANKKR